MTSRVRLLLNWIKAAALGESATRITRRDIQGDTEPGYAERHRQHQQFSLVEIEHRASQPLIGTSCGGLIGEINVAATAQAQISSNISQHMTVERHAPRGLAGDSPSTEAEGVNGSIMESACRSCWSILLTLKKYCSGVQKHQAPHSSEARPVRRTVFIRPRATITAECGAIARRRRA
jgi:hypothetical protein